MTSPPCASPASPPRPPPRTPLSSPSQPSSPPSPPATAPPATSSTLSSAPKTSIPMKSFPSREHAITITLSLMKLSDYVIQFIAGQGVRHVFLVTGGGAMHLNQSLGAQSAVQPVCNSHEQASAICAEAYAKATNHLGVCMVTTGPGGTNAVTGVAGAWLDSTPMLVVSGQVKRLTACSP